MPAPEWMVLDAIPVIPRILPANGGALMVAASPPANLVGNDLYRRWIHRNNRLARLQEILAPEIIVPQRKADVCRRLLNAPDRQTAAAERPWWGQATGRLQSLSDLKLRQTGPDFRQNLLGKTVGLSPAAR